VKARGVLGQSAFLHWFSQSPEKSVRYQGKTHGLNSVTASTKYKVRGATEIPIVLVWGSQMSQSGNRGSASSSSLSYKGRIFDGPRQRSFEF